MEIVEIWQNLLTIGNYLTILVKNSQVVDGDDGDLAKLVKKRITDHDLPRPLYVDGK